MHVSCFGVLSRTGIIYEVACQQCGGNDNLENAVKRGDVKRKGSMYYFPKHTIGIDRKFVIEEEMSQKQERTQDEYQLYNTGVQSMIGDISPHPLNGTVWGLPFGAISNSSGPPAICSGGKEAAVNSVKDKRDRLCKAISLADKCTTMVAWQDSPPARVMSELAAIRGLGETAEKMQTEMGFIVKFGKDFKNAEVTESSAAAIAVKAEEVTSKIVQSVKCIRALVGPSGSRDLLA